MPRINIAILPFSCPYLNKNGNSIETKINIANKQPLIDEIASLKLIVVLKLLIIKVQIIPIIVANIIKVIVVRNTYHQHHKRKYK